MRKSKRIIAILATVALVATMLIPVAGPAVASGTNVSVLQTPDVSDNAWQTLGTVKVEVEIGALQEGDSATLTLPDDFKFYDARYGLGFTDDDSQHVYTICEDANGNGAYDSGEKVRFRMIIPKTYSGDENDLYKAGVNTLNPAVLDDNEIQITVNDNYVNSGNQNVFFCYFDSIWVEDGFTGDVIATLEAPSASGFPSGKAPIARVPGGQVDLTVPSVDTMSSDTDLVVKFRAKELTSGSFEADSESMKIKLPNGFCFESQTAPSGFLKVNTSNYIAFRKIWGGDVVWGVPEVNSSKDEITLSVTAESTEAGYFEFAVTIAVDDEDQAKTGDVVAKVRGESDFNATDLTIAVYGEAGAKIEADGTVPDVIAGQYNQDVADLKITENVANSLNANKTVTIELPACAKWTNVDTSGDSDSGADIDFVGFVGSDARELKYKVTDTSTSDAAELVLEDFQIAVEPGFTGDIAVTVGGTEGLSGDVVIAHAKAAVEMTASAVPDVKIGLQNQAAGDLVIKENIAEAIKADKNLIIDLPDGVKFTSVPKVAVDGDLDIDEDNVKRQSEDNQLLIPIDGESSSPGTITISGIAYTVDRTVAEGNLTVKLKGDAVMEVNDRTAIEEDFDDNETSSSGFQLDIDGDGDTDFTMDGSDGFFPTTTSAAKVANATCATPAPSDENATVVFKINDTSYTVNGVAQTMDIAPYIKDGRTFLPVRYVALACGVSADNILFSNGKVTLIKGDKVVQMTIGSKVMIINGASIDMDVAAEISNGRTMLPFRFIAQALGASVTFDDTAQTVTMVI